MTDSSLASTWLNLAPGVAEQLAASKDISPTKLAQENLISASAKVYVADVLGDAVFEPTSFPIKSQRLLAGALSRPEDTALQTAVDWTLRYAMDGMERFVAWSGLRETINERHVLKQAIPDWLWDLAFTVAWEEEIIFMASKVPAHKFLKLTEVFMSLNTKETKGALKIKLNWYDNGRALRFDEWSDYNTSQFWALFNVDYAPSY